MYVTQEDKQTNIKHTPAIYAVFCSSNIRLELYFV